MAVGAPGWGRQGRLRVGNGFFSPVFREQSEGFLEADAEGAEPAGSQVQGAVCGQSRACGAGGFLRLPARPPAEARKGMGAPGLQEGWTGSGSASGQTVTGGGREKAADGVGAGRERRPGPPKTLRWILGAPLQREGLSPRPRPARDLGPARLSRSRSHCCPQGCSPTVPRAARPTVSSGVLL